MEENQKISEVFDPLFTYHQLSYAYPPKSYCNHSVILKDKNFTELFFITRTFIFSETFLLRLNFSPTIASQFLSSLTFLSSSSKNKFFSLKTFSEPYPLPFFNLFLCAPHHFICFYLFRSYSFFRCLQSAAIADTL